MGVYVVTMRAAKIVVDGLTIGSYKFAYKPWGYGEEPPHFARAVNAKHSAATRAKKANEGVDLFTYGDLTPCPDHGGVPVYRIPDAHAAVYDSAFDRQPVGVLKKNGKGWAFEARPASE